MNKKIFGIILGLLLVFSFTKNINAQNCGAVGQPCCTSGSACNSGLECQGRFCKVPATVTCGGVGQPCCTSGSACNSGLDCQGRFCKAPIPVIFGGGATTKAIDPTCQGGTGIETAIGCISVLGDQNAYLADILRWAVGVGGGIAFLLIVYAGFMIMSSAGSPDRLKAGQELMTSAISGIVLLVLSVFVLRVIGVDILKIPGFGN